jgi:predicted Zn-dependent protease with MMP-like domain
MENSQTDKQRAEDDNQLDPRVVEGWRALDLGDVDAAQAAAEAVLGGASGAEANVQAATSANTATNGSAGAKTTQKRGNSAPVDASRMDALLLMAACAREKDDVESALANLRQAAQADPDWCTPELWMAELLTEDPDQLDEALRHARRALDRAEEEDEYLDAIKCKAVIELDLGRPTEARKTLSGLPPADVPLDDPDVTLDFAQLLMDADDPGEARARLEVLVEAEPELADAWYLLGATAELLDDEDGKRAAWNKTRALDVASLAASDAAGHKVESEGERESVRGAEHRGGREGGRAGEPESAALPRLQEDVLVALAEEALGEMPEEIRSQMREVPIVVADLPAAADVATGLDPRLLGMFSGTPHADSAGVLAPGSLTEIVLFRCNIERAAVDEESLRDEVRTTLLHEAGHFFGLDEAALARLGLQ